MLKRIAQRKLSILKPGIMAAVSITKAALRMSVNNPKVITVMGRVKMNRIGLIVTLMTAKTNDARSAIVKSST